MFGKVWLLSQNLNLKKGKLNEFVEDIIKKYLNKKPYKNVNYIGV